MKSDLNNIGEQIAKKFDGAKLTPPEECWDGIISSPEVSTVSKRKYRFWFLFGPFALLVGSILFSSDSGMSMDSINAVVSSGESYKAETNEAKITLSPSVGSKKEVTRTANDLVKKFTNASKEKHSISTQNHTFKSDHPGETQLNTTQHQRLSVNSTSPKALRTNGDKRTSNLLGLDNDQNQIYLSKMRLSAPIDDASSQTEEKKLNNSKRTTSATSHSSEYGALPFRSPSMLSPLPGAENAIVASNFSQPTEGSLLANRRIQLRADIGMHLNSFGTNNGAGTEFSTKLSESYSNNFGYRTRFCADVPIIGGISGYAGIAVNFGTNKLNTTVTETYIETVDTIFTYWDSSLMTWITYAGPFDVEKTKENQVSSVNSYYSISIPFGVQYYRSLGRRFFLEPDLSGDLTVHGKFSGTYLTNASAGVDDSDNTFKKVGVLSINLGCKLGIKTVNGQSLYLYPWYARSVNSTTTLNANYAGRLTKFGVGIGYKIQL